MNNFVSAGDTFENWLGDIKYDPTEQKLYPFMARVGVVKYRPPRHECFEYLREMGSGAIENVLYHKGEISGVMAFVFPERHMSVHEQRTFMYSLVKHPTVKKVTQVDIITSCPLLVGDFHKEMIRIITWPEDEEKAEIHPFFKDSGALNPNTVNDVL